MDKSWMMENRMSIEYDVGVESSIKFGLSHAKGSNSIRCSCLKCGNRLLKNVSIVRYHLYANGIDKSYKIWFWHCEDLNSTTVSSKMENTVDENYEHDNLFNTVSIFQSAHDESCNTSNTFDTMFDDAKKPLYPECKKFTKLLALVRLYNLKVRYGWSNTSFSELLSIISDLLPDNNEIPTSLYEAKKTLGALGLSYKKIDACPNDCCLYRKEYANLTKCPKYGLSRWKINKNSTKEHSGVAAKQMWYFPIVPRFIRMFKNLKNAKNLRWHAMDRKVDGIIRYSADTPSWRLIDHMWPTFGRDYFNQTTTWEKNVYMGQRKYLPRHYPYRLQKKNFDGKQEHGNPPQPLSGETIYFKLKEMIFSCGKKCDKNNNEGTFLDIPGKSKDGMNSRLDLVEMNIRPELAPMVTKLDALQEDIVMTLCNLEKYFPPSFSTIMVHLVVHLVREAKLCGPVYFWWMYPFERYMKVLKSFVRNRNRPEGCIAKAQVCEEAVQFCSDFLSRLDPIGLGSLNSREDKQIDRPLSAGTYVRPDIAKNEQWLQVEHNRSFNAWIRDKVMCELHEGKVVSNTIQWLAHSLNCGVMTYKGYMVNGCSYHTKSRDDHRTVQNSGIMLVATTMQTGVRIDDLHFTLVDLSRIGHSSNSFVIATHGKQVFYVSDLVDPRWSVVVMPPQKDFPYKCANDDLGDMLSHYPQSQNGIQQLTLMKVGIQTLDLIVEAHGLPLDFHRTKSVRDTNPTDVATPKEKGESSTQKRKRGPTEMKEITRARRTTVRFHVPITYSGWSMVPKEIKDKIFELIEAGFVVDPRSKKTIIQNAGVCFHQFKYRLTTTYVLPFLDDVEKLKFPLNEYSFIDQQHWTEFVASRLKEDFKKKSKNGKEKRKKHKYNHRTSRKGYVNLMEELKASSPNQIDQSIVWKQARMDHKEQIPDEEMKEVVNLIDKLVATQKTTNAFGEEDILTRALGGKDHPGILRGVGKYVTKKVLPYRNTTKNK
ncbi:hypothetical protein E6C27_scaffold131G00070 [Cucumis melo var. makuwa]|uniref:Transposase n=1 Tax=Cucumis melo var. makuwa TaxID=1194695 RepID=A0A5A7UKM5_CUCMM|nr:hypothetical protein E6C27_scaffold131G00070 [Cucumis melo var. makuwa]